MRLPSVPAPTSSCSCVGEPMTGTSLRIYSPITMHVTLRVLAAAAVVLDRTVVSACTVSDGTKIQEWMKSCDSISGGSQAKCDNKACHIALHRLIEEETAACYAELGLGSTSDLAKYKPLDDFCHGEGPDPAPTVPSPTPPPATLPTDPPSTKPAPTSTTSPPTYISPQPTSITQPLASTAPTPSVSEVPSEIPRDRPVDPTAITAQSKISSLEGSNTGLSDASSSGGEIESPDPIVTDSPATAHTSEAPVSSAKSETRDRSAMTMIAITLFAVVASI